MAELIERLDAINSLHNEIVRRRVYGEEPIDEFDTESILRSLSPVQPEITQDQLEEYCKKRCLTVITDDLLYKLTSGSKNTANFGDITTEPDKPVIALADALYVARGSDK